MDGAEFSTEYSEQLQGENLLKVEDPEIKANPLRYIFTSVRRRSRLKHLTAHFWVRDKILEIMLTVMKRS